MKADSKTKMVVVKGPEADPAKVCERVQKKTGRRVELISPLPPPPPPEEEKKEEPPKEEPPPEEKKEEASSLTQLVSEYFLAILSSFFRIMISCKGCSCQVYFLCSDSDIGLFRNLANNMIHLSIHDSNVCVFGN